MRTAVCPGSFDPLTMGHMDVITRASRLFDRVIVCVMVNGEKRPLLSPEERLRQVEQAVAPLGNVQAAQWSGLLADFAQKENACALVKGVRGVTDFDWESQMARINGGLWEGLETVLLPASPKWSHVSSTMVRDLLRHHRDISPWVPDCVAAALLK